ncbi:MAG: hypothetical protein ACPK7O_07455 [Methanobacterium sp.]
MTLKITDSEIDIKKLLSVKDFNTETKNRIKNSEILIIPKDLNNRAFFPGTSDFLKSAKKELSPYQISLCANMGENSVLLYNSMEEWLPHIFLNINVLNDIILPSVINFITAYIFQKFMAEDKIHFKMTVKSNSKNIDITYDGNVSEFKEIEKIIEILKENEKQELLLTMENVIYH